jgi:hypothetical protein
LLAPYIVYVVVALAIGVSLVTGSLVFHPSLLEYYCWLAVDMVIASVFVGHSYMARAANALPEFEDRMHVTSRAHTSTFPKAAPASLSPEQA